jgi:hypothetical protein
MEEYDDLHRTRWNSDSTGDLPNIPDDDDDEENGGRGGGAGSEGEGFVAADLKSGGLVASGAEADADTEEEDEHSCDWGEWECRVCGKTPFVFRS